MAWYKLTPAEPGEAAYFFYSGDPDDGAALEKGGWQIDLSPSQRTQLAYLLLTGKPMPKSEANPTSKETNNN
jgi:hypothetical protein